MPESPRRHLALGTLLATGAQIAPLVASAAMSLAIARLYGPSRTGVISLVLNLFDVVLQIFTIGLSSGITFLISRGEWPMRRAAHQMWRAAAVLGVAGASCGMAFYLLTRDTIFKGVTPQLAIISLASLPFALAWGFAAAAALGRDRYETYAGLELAYSMVILLAGVALAAIFGLTGAVAAFAGANVLTAVLGVAWTRRAAAGANSQEGETSRHQLRAATKFGLQAWSANLLQLLNYRLDLFILSSVALRSAVGVYSIAVSVTALGWVLPNALQTVLFPRVANMDAAAASGGLAAETSDAAAASAVRHSVLIMVPTSIVLAGLVLLVPLIYGSGFNGSVTLGFILIPGVAALGIAKVLSAIFSGRGFPRYAFYTTAITVPVTLALYFALIPRLHATGAAAATSVSYVMTMALSATYFRRVTAIPLREALIPSRSDFADYGDALRAGLSHLRKR